MPEGAVEHQWHQSCLTARQGPGLCYPSSGESSVRDSPPTPTFLNGEWAPLLRPVLQRRRWPRAISRHAELVKGCEAALTEPTTPSWIPVFLSPNWCLHILPVSKAWQLYLTTSSQYDLGHSLSQHRLSPTTILTWSAWILLSAAVFLSPTGRRKKIN